MGEGRVGQVGVEEVEGLVQSMHFTINVEMSLAVVMSIWMSEISQPNPRVYGMDEDRGW